MTSHTKSRTPSSAYPFFATPLPTYSDSNSRTKVPSPLLLQRCHPNLLPSDELPTRPFLLCHDELEHELDNFITLQLQLQTNNTPTIHNVAQSVSSFKFSSPVFTVEGTRAHRVFKRKHTNAQTLPQPRPPRLFSPHPQHTNTKETL